MPTICNAGFLLSFYSLILTSRTVYAPWQPLAAVQTHVWDMATASVATFYVNFCLTCSLPILKYCQQYRGESMCTTQCLWTQHEILRNVRCVCAGGSPTFSCVAAGGGLASKAEPVGDKQLHPLISTRGVMAVESVKRSQCSFCWTTWSKKRQSKWTSRLDFLNLDFEDFG